MWRISMFSRYRSCVLLYKSAYYKVITYLQETCSVFSIQFFSLLLPLSVKIVYYIYNNIYIYNIK